MITKPLIYDMRVECAWCGKFLYMSKCVSPGQISHGICEDCKELLFAEHFKGVEAPHQEAR